MKRNTFILIVASLLAFAGNMWADTDKLPAADGWTKISSVPTSQEIANNYYVFVDATRDLMLGIGKGVQNTKAWYSLALYYRTSVEPTSKDITQMVWTLESDNGGFSMRNLESPVRVFQTEWNAAQFFDTNDVTSPNEWSKVILALSDGKFTLQNGYYTSGYIGPCTDNNFTNGAECAGNKTGSSVGKFHIYAISRTQFKQNLLDNASNSNPVDLTPWYVTNPTLDQNADGWTSTFTANSASWWGSHAFSNTGAENYQQVANFYQTLTLPNGKYKVAMQGATSKPEENEPYVYGIHNGAKTKTYFTQSTQTTTDGSKWNDMQYTLLQMMSNHTWGQVMTDEITVTTNALTIGYANEGGWSWDVFDNFKLYCTGVDLSAYKDQLSDLVDECTDFIDSDVVPTACENAISSAITTYNQSYETAKEYSTAIVALTTILETYQNDTELQSAYAAYKTMRTNVQGLGNTSTYKYTDPGTAKSTLDAAITAANTAVEAATTASAINTQTANIRAAAMTFISSVTAEDGNPFNLTFLASTAAADWQTASGLDPAATAPAWSVPKPDESMADFVESYTQAAGGESITGNILYQTLSGMPAGYYTVALYAAASFTPGRGLEEKCTDGQPNITFGFAGESSLSLPVVHRTTLSAADQVPVNLSVQLASSGDLTFGIKKTAAGSNWHVAQIYTITYSKDPDLTILKADRDALVSEAQGLLASDDASLLTTAQQNALSSAISTAEAANTFDALTEVTMTSLPNAIQTARQQISTVKANRVLMLEALERFETDYNLTDGTDYRRLTMSAGAWTDLLTAVNNVTTAMDDVSRAASYGTLKDALIAKMDATDASLRLFKSYKAMVEGTQSLSIAEGTTYAANSYMDTDATQQTAITALNTAYGTYAASQTNDFVVSAFLGSNLDFSAAEGTVINNDNSNNIRNVDGWEVEYADADTWAVLQTHQGDNDEKLYMRKNWGDGQTTLMVRKQKMLPVGRYQLSLSWNSNMANMTNRSSFTVGEAKTDIGESGNKTLTYEFAVTGTATTFDLVLGFKRTGTNDNAAQLIVDDVTLTALGVNNVLIKDYDPAAAEFDATGYAAASGVTLSPTNLNQIIYAANAGQLTNIDNVVIGGTCANFVITDKDIHTTNDFSATAATYTRTMAAGTQYGTLLLPFPIDVANSDVNFFTLKEITTGESGKMTFSPVEGSTIDANTPLLFKKKTSGAESITVVGSGSVPAIGVSAEDTQGGCTVIGYYQGDDGMKAVDNTYYISSDKFWKATGTLHMQPFRAIFIAPSGSGGARSFIIDIDDKPTGIEELDGSKAQEFKSSNWYDLNGRRLKGKPTRKGFYIIDGKKVYVR